MPDFCMAGKDLLGILGTIAWHSNIKRLFRLSPRLMGHDY